MDRYKFLDLLPCLDVELKLIGHPVSGGCWLIYENILTIMITITIVIIEYDYDCDFIAIIITIVVQYIF